MRKDDFFVELQTKIEQGHRTNEIETRAFREREKMSSMTSSREALTVYSIPGKYVSEFVVTFTLVWDFTG